jgi:hypothetical protein
MKRAVAGLFGLLALGGCGGSGLEAEWPGPPRPSASGTVAVGPFNDYLVKYEDYASSPEALATEFLRLDTQSAGSTMMLVSAPGEERERVTVAVELDRLADDSVHAVTYTLVMARQGSGWRLRSASWKQRCQPGRGHQEFSIAPCV